MFCKILKWDLECFLCDILMLYEWQKNSAFKRAWGFKYYSCFRVITFKWEREASKTLGRTSYKSARTCISWSRHFWTKNSHKIRAARKYIHLCIFQRQQLRNICFLELMISRFRFPLWVQINSKFTRIYFSTEQVTIWPDWRTMQAGSDSKQCKKGQWPGKTPDYLTIWLSDSH